MDARTGDCHLAVVRKRTLIVSRAVGTLADYVRQLVTQKRIERLRKFDPDSVVINIDALEEGLVVEPPYVVTGDQVAAVAVARVGQCGLQVFLHGLELHVAGIKTRFDVGELAGDTLLLSLQEVQRHGSRVVGLQQSGSFAQQPFLLRRQVSALGGSAVPR